MASEAELAAVAEVRRDHPRFPEITRDSRGASMQEIEERRLFTPESVCVEHDLLAVSDAGARAPHSVISSFIHLHFLN